MKPLKHIVIIMQIVQIFHVYEILISFDIAHLLHGCCSDIVASHDWHQSVKNPIKYE